MVDLNEFSSIFLKVHNSHSRHQKTTSNFLRNTLKGSLTVSNERSLDGAMVHELMTILRASRKDFFFFFFFFLCLEILMVSDKTTDKAFIIHEQNPVENLLLFIYFLIQSNTSY